jgi:hypothetical protein
MAVNADDALSSTNVTLPSGRGTRLATNRFDSSGSFNFAHTVNPNLPLKFFGLPLP